jgi:hypothetical protein
MARTRSKLSKRMWMQSASLKQGPLGLGPVGSPEDSGVGYPGTGPEILTLSGYRPEDA